MPEHVEKLNKKRKEIASALNAGIKEANQYEKPYDKQLMIITYLGKAGYTIIKKRN